MFVRDQATSLTELANADPADIILIVAPKRICSQELK
jgi:hypothetical protein